MKDSRSRLVVDTSVIIDFIRAGIDENIFRLPFQFVTPDVVLAELENSDSSRLVEFGLISSELDGGQLKEVGFLRQYNIKISFNDICALILASYLNVTLLTGDKNLNKLAQKHNVKVHGTLWVLDELIQLTQLSERQAAIALRQMINSGSRLPEDECNKRLRLWEKSSNN
jgi:predicted nucleic acid-binding protein